MSAAPRRDAARPPARAAATVARSPLLAMTLLVLASTLPLALALVPRAAQAASPVRVFGDSQCPSPARVAAAVSALAPGVDVVAADEQRPGALRVRLWDD